jgi:DNA primase
LIPNETVSLIRERVDIVEVIGESVELKRAGASFKGLCPFHQEKTPSFNVNPARQMFHCFGCGVGGDVISFVMNYEGRTFSDAVRELGERIGIEVEEVRESSRARSERGKQSAERERLIDVMEIAAAFYARQLEAERGRGARAYLESRAIPQEMIAEFGLGYAPAEWDALVGALGGLGVSQDEAERAGLVAPRRSGGGHYDRFRDRITFPVHDAAGRVVALGGRVLPGAPKDAPKYVNSPESPIFSKSRTLYGLARAREALRRRETPILVEGNLDVISMHAHGFRSAVAPMGTALTVEQVSLLRRFAGAEMAVVLLFDGDEAGRNAALRAHSVLAEGGLGARVALLPPSEDPDSFLRRHGPGELAKVVASATGLVEHLIKDAARKAGDDAHGKARGIRSLGGVVAKVGDPIEQDLYRRQIAHEFGVSEELVFKYLRASDATSSGEPGGERPAARRKAEGAITGALLDHPELYAEALNGGVLNLVVDRNLRWVIERLGDVAKGELQVTQIVELAPNERIAQRVQARLVEQPIDDVGQARQVIEQSLAKLRELTEREGAGKLQQEIARAEQAGDKDQAGRLAQEKLERKRAAGADPDGATGR